MGKYNFNYERIKALEEKNAQLLAQNKELVDHVQSLSEIVGEMRTQLNASKKQENRKKGVLYDVVDTNVLDELFGEEPNVSGEIVQCDDERKISKFNTFVRNVIGVVFLNTRSTGNVKHINMPLKDMTEEQYEASRKLIKEVLELCYKCKVESKEEAK